MKNTMMLLGMLLAATLAFALPASADYSGNNDLGTLVINDSNPNRDGSNFYQLFNNYFAEEMGLLGMAAYENSNDLFQERGVKEVVENWTVSTNSTIAASFKNAALVHELNLVDGNGNVVQTTVFPSDTTSQVITNVDPISLGAGEYNFTLGAGGETFHGDDPTKNSDGLIHMIAFDVTDLVRLMFDDMTIESAYLFGWEDLNVNSWYADFDYQDLAYLMINVSPNPAAVTPEPASALIFGVGLIGMGMAGRTLRRKKK